MSSAVEHGVDRGAGTWNIESRFLYYFHVEPKHYVQRQYGGLHYIKVIEKLNFLYKTN